MPDGWPTWPPPVRSWGPVRAIVPGRRRPPKRRQDPDRGAAWQTRWLEVLVPFIGRGGSSPPPDTLGLCPAVLPQIVGRLRVAPTREGHVLRNNDDWRTIPG